MPLSSLSKIFCGDAGSAKRERRKDARPGELLEAALDLFVEKGYAATRVEEVAARAGVSKGTLFLYYPSKEELFKAVVRDTMAGRFQEWATEFDSYSGSSAEMLAYCMESWWMRIGSTQASGIYKLMVCEGGNFPEIADFYRTEVVEPGRLLIRRVIERGVASGEFRAMDAGQAAYSVIAPMVYLMLAKHCPYITGPSQGALEPVAFIAAQCQTLLHGWCPAEKAAL